MKLTPRRTINLISCGFLLGGFIHCLEHEEPWWLTASMVFGAVVCFGVIFLPDPFEMKK